MSQIALKVTQFVAESLGLLPSTAYATKTVNQTAPLTHLAKQPGWRLLSETHCFQEIFDCGEFRTSCLWLCSSESALD